MLTFTSTFETNYMVNVCFSIPYLYHTSTTMQRLTLMINPNPHHNPNPNSSHNPNP